MYSLHDDSDADEGSDLEPDSDAGVHILSFTPSVAAGLGYVYVAATQRHA